MIGRRRYTRRQALAEAGRVGVAGAMALARPAAAADSGPARGAQRQPAAATLRAAVARIIPASGPGDWSAADVGADTYILTLLSARHRKDLRRRGRTARASGASSGSRGSSGSAGAARSKRLQGVYSQGLAQLDAMAGGNFAAAPDRAPGRDPDRARRRGQRLLRRALQPHDRGGLLAPGLRRQQGLPRLEGVRLRGRRARRAVPADRPAERPVERLRRLRARGDGRCRGEEHMRRSALIVAVLAALHRRSCVACGRPPATAQPAAPFQYDALGPIRDVTANWHRLSTGAACSASSRTSAEYTPGGTGADRSRGATRRAAARGSRAARPASS